MNRPHLKNVFQLHIFVGASRVSAKPRLSRGEDGILPQKFLKKPGILTHIPQGTFYVLNDLYYTDISSDTFTDRLLDEHQAALSAGATYGAIADKTVRISMAADDHGVLENLKDLLPSSGKIHRIVN